MPGPSISPIHNPNLPDISALSLGDEVPNPNLPDISPSDILATMSLGIDGDIFQSNIIEKYLEQSGIGHEDYRSSEADFHVVSIDEEQLTSPRNQSEVVGIDINSKMNTLEDYRIPDFLKNLFTAFKAPNREICHFTNFRIMSIDEIIYKKEKNPKFVDFGFFSIGMGRIIVISWRIEDGKCFFRSEGGSNGHEVYANKMISETLDPFDGTYTVPKYSLDEDNNLITSEKSKKTEMKVFDINDFFSSLTNGEFSSDQFGRPEFPEQFELINT